METAMRIWIEGSIERRSDKVRTRMRLCKDGIIVAACRVTKTLGREERIPKEFLADPRVQAEMFDAVEEIWKHRMRLLQNG
jgi:hypothetical protein